jgi:uncharacterized membrane protein
MTSSRLEAFSDGVLAIIITIMVLELKIPHESTWNALGERRGVFLSYGLSFIYLGIYWNNHHNMLHVTKRVTGQVLWANLHLLFWLSIVPFGTAWLGESGGASAPTQFYAIILFCSGAAYYLLASSISRADGPNCPVALVQKRDVKGKASLVLYLVSIACASRYPTIAYGIFILVAIMWFIPDRRFQQVQQELNDKDLLPD